MTLDKLREIAKAATQGPWKCRGGFADDVASFAPQYRDSPTGAYRLGCLGPADGKDPWANNKYIATFNPQTVLALLDYIAALEEECENPSDKKIMPTKYEIRKQLD